MQGFHAIFTFPEKGMETNFRVTSLWDSNAPFNLLIAPASVGIVTDWVHFPQSVTTCSKVNVEYDPESVSYWWPGGSLFPNSGNFKASYVTGEPSTMSATILLGSMILQAVVFMASLAAIVWIWMFLLNTLKDLDAAKSKILVQLLGGLTANGELTGKGKARIAGTGVVASILILAFAVGAIYFIGNHTYSSKPKTEMPKK
jgi:hypothetical protein